MAKKKSKKQAAAGRRPSRVPRRRGEPAQRVQQHTPSIHHEPIVVVGVGASAGGLEAFSSLLRSLPLEPGFAIVFVQHLAPTHESALVPLLSVQTPLPVEQATDGMRVLRNRVYIIPPNARMVIEGETLRVSPRPDDHSQYTPIDTFLGSLASSTGNRAIAVILSGTASDGASGVRDVKAAGGVAVAQAPSSAKYDGMPRAAIATGLVDLVLPVEAIGPQLVQLAGHAYALTATGVRDLALTDQQLQQIFGLLRPASGVDFRHYKLPTIKRRLMRRMDLHRLGDVNEYIGRLRADVGEVQSLYRDLLIHVTRFFREPESFEALQREVFPSLLEGRPPDRPIRVWVSGCATGEEAYSLAICLQEFLQREHSDVRVQIFATDISESAIEHARAGVYAPGIEADVSADRLRRFFTSHDRGYRVSKTVRDLCVFARQDLTRDPPFSRLDLILCRNVLIYLELLLQKKLLSVFHYALLPTGYLVLGQAETVGDQASLFSLIDKKFRIHRKKPAALAPAMSFPLEQTAAGAPEQNSRAEHNTTGKFIHAEVSRLLMDRFAPPGVVIDSDMQIVEFRGQTGPYLEPAPGDASLNLLKMAKEGLLYGLRTTIQNAQKVKGPVRKEGLQVRSSDSWKPVTLEVIPLSGTGRAHYLVLFEDPGEPGKMPPAKRIADVPIKPPHGKSGREQVTFLQRELAASREYLQSIIQELEAANEELQSANEEILSSNEELQSTNEELDTAKEELQSTNEELNTVNEELHGRNEELSRVNSDLINLLGSVQIAIVILGSDLRIRRFTPMAEKVLNLIPADVDRMIGHINPNIEVANLEALILECIDTIAPIEREVRDHQGRWYSMRIRPYRSIDNRIDGAVLALFDIDAPKRHEEAARTALAIADAVLQASSDPMAVLDSEYRVRQTNRAFVELFPALHDGAAPSITKIVGHGPGLDRLLAASQPGSAAPGELHRFELQPSTSTSAFQAEARTLASSDSIQDRALLLTVRKPPAPVIT